MPERLNLSRLAMLALCAVIGLQLAWIVAGLLGGRDLPLSDGGAFADPRRASAAAADAGQATVARIAAAGLFGQASATLSGVGAAPATSLGLVLVGVFAREEPEGGRAIIGESAAAARLYAVGATLPGGARLLEVRGDHVILGVGGTREALYMPRTLMPGLSGTGSSSGAAPVPPLVGAASAAAQSAPGALPDPNQLVRWQAILRDGRIAGVRVYPGERAELFQRAGLQSGDLVVEINGMPVASEAGAAQFAQTLAASPSSTLRIERGGQPQELRVDLARLMASGAE